MIQLLDHALEPSGFHWFRHRCGARLNALELLGELLARSQRQVELLEVGRIELEQQLERHVLIDKDRKQPRERDTIEQRQQSSISAREVDLVAIGIEQAT